MNILRYPDPRLAAKNAPLGAWTPAAAANVEEMFKSMAAVDGVGLAASQIGWNVRLFIMAIMDKEAGETTQTIVFDPVVEYSGEERFVMEGCLSLPGISGRIRRWTRARLTGQTPNGPIDEVMDGLAAQAVQHEMDHLDGILYIEKMTSADRHLVEPQLKALEAGWKNSRERL